MKAIVLTSFVVWLSACSARPIGSEPASPPGESPAPSELVPATQRPSVTPVADPMAPADLIVHEWGTFTSVGSSTGALMEGLHHEEEPLPAFVHGRGAAAGGPVMQVERECRLRSTSKVADGCVTRG